MCSRRDSTPSSMQFARKHAEFTVSERIGHTPHDDNKTASRRGVEETSARNRDYLPRKAPRGNYVDYNFVRRNDNQAASAREGSPELVLQGTISSSGT